ncbi:hypothetical protein ACFQ48_02670 [Hymenobacter caeli]|uniref:Multidrug efflux pump subunit AcrA (Membrane-fusion protein) n=1 Tax=Hymenobacter caeli TaxID=2735894 RepID=A0ABX2FL40_9BACT|nr:hypothetical protein [Hymenobacter caeli]NRT17726.1 multidrug efflux pump subunit AcrA (membrane-fusion protein) [Hymenobacter caeli]
MPVISGLYRAVRRREAGSPPVALVVVGQRTPGRPTGPALAGTVLAAPRQVLRVPGGGHVTQVYFSEDQRVAAGSLLLKLAVGPLSRARIVFVSAPAAGEVRSLQVSAGDYLAAGAPYAYLTQSRPVRVQVPAAAARLCPGDSLQILAGPPGLAGEVSALAAVVPATAPGTAAVLVLKGLRWPRPSPAPVVVAPLRGPQPPVVASD